MTADVSHKAHGTRGPGLHSRHHPGGLPLLVPMVAGLVLMWALALMHDAGYVAPTHAAGHA